MVFNIAELEDHVFCSLQCHSGFTLSFVRPSALASFRTPPVSCLALAVTILASSFILSGSASRVMLTLLLPESGAERESANHPR